MRIIVRLRLLMSLNTMAYAAFLPAYSDRIVQDSHLIPFYPRVVAQTALNLRGTEKSIYEITFLLYRTARQTSIIPGLSFVIIDICGIENAPKTLFFECS